MNFKKKLYQRGQKKKIIFPLKSVHTHTHTEEKKGWQKKEIEKRGRDTGGQKYLNSDTRL